MDVPDVSYARSGDVAIAYQVVGEGPTDIVFVRGTLADLLAGWDMPLFVDHVEGLARSARAILFDMDGVLVRSFEVWFRVVEEAGRRFRGRAITRGEFTPTFGQGTADDVPVFGLS